MYRRVYDNKVKNEQLCPFVNGVSCIAYTHNEFNDFKYLNNIEVWLYIKQLEVEDSDTRKVTYDFLNRFYRFNVYSAKRNPDIRYYDNLMSNILLYTVQLITKDDTNAIKVLLNNLSMEIANYNEDDFSEIDIINFQFCCGIIVCYMVFLQEKKLSDKKIEILKSLVNYIKNHLIWMYDAVRVVQRFKMYYRKTTCVQSVYNEFDITLIDHEFQSSWSGTGVSETAVLRELLWIFNIDDAYYAQEDIKNINRDDKWFLKALNDSLVAEKNELEEKVNTEFDKSDVLKYVGEALKKAENDEKEFNQNRPINMEHVRYFENEIKNELNKENKLIKTLSKLNKVELSKEKLKKVFGISQLISREFFFDNSFAIDSLVKNIVSAFNTAIHKEYMNKIIQMKKVELDGKLEKFENIDKYVIITDYVHFRFLDKYKFDSKTSTVIINEKKVKVIQFQKMGEVYLIEKNKLPRIKYCGFDNTEWNIDNVDGSIYYEFNDCSVENEVRKEIIDNNEWLNEFGDYDAKDDYLKGKCRLKIFMAYNIIPEEGVIIRVKENEKE